MKPLVRANIEVRPSGIHGYGVFTTAAVPANTLLEECYLLHLPEETSLLRSYVFKWNKETCVLPLGYGAIYNHADQSNAYYEMDEARNVMVVKSRRALAKGEEVLIFYGKHWFSSRLIQPAQKRWPYRAWRWLRQSAIPRFAFMVAILLTVLKHVST